MLMTAFSTYKKGAIYASLVLDPFHSPSPLLQSAPHPMSISGIQGQQLELSVVACIGLRKTEYFGRQDPYVSFEYGDVKLRTRTCTDGGKNPTFQDKFNFTLIEDRREIRVDVWNSHRIRTDDHIGGGRIQLQKVLRDGYDESLWPLQTNDGRPAGEIRLTMRCPNLNRPPPSAYPPAPYPALPAAYPPPPTYPATPYPGQYS